MSMISQKLHNISPVYLAEFEELIKDHSQFGGGAKGNKYIHAKTFSNVYEFYMYAYFIGLYKGLKEEIVVDDRTVKFWEMNHWKPKDLVDYLLMCAIEESDFDMVGIEQMDDDEAIGQIRLVKQEIEKYANGGLRYIRDKLETEPELAGDDMFFIRLLSEADRRSSNTT